MNYAEFRRFGFVSQLSRIEAKGPDQSVVQKQNSVTDQEIQLAQQQQTAAQADKERAQALQQPLIDKESALATGDRSAAVKAALPVISQLSSGYAASKESVFNTLPPGAARDKALADLATRSTEGKAQAQAGEVSKAPEILANVGSGVGAFSLQELGAALSGFGGASSSNQAAGSLEAKQSEAKWAPLTALAGVAGSTAGSLIKPR